MIALATIGKPRRLAALLLSGALLVALAAADSSAAAGPVDCSDQDDRAHATAARELIDRAYSRRRILDASPARTQEIEKWRAHARCVSGEDVRRGIRRKVRRSAAAFDARFIKLITPPGPRTLRARRECETNGDYEEGSGGLSGYKGAYQFDRYSWDRTAGRFRRMTGLKPDRSRIALPREQDIRAAIWTVMADQDPWPNCP